MSTEIQKEIETALAESGLSLSQSKVAEWRLWAYVVASVIGAFKILLDVFRKEVDALTDKITPGTVRWYAEMCYRFQNGYKLEFDEKTAMLYYPVDAPGARIIKIVAITEKPNLLLIKAAKQDAGGKIQPLGLEEKYNFSAYIDAINFAGVTTNVVSTTEDLLRYHLKVWFEPAVPNSLVRSNVRQALEGFKTSLGFDSMIYRQKLIDAVMGAEGVVTCKLEALERLGVSDNGVFQPVDIYAVLESGYFEYAEESVLELASIKEIDK